MCLSRTLVPMYSRVIVTLLKGSTHAHNVSTIGYISTNNPPIILALRKIVYTYKGILEYRLSLSFMMPTIPGNEPRNAECEHYSEDVSRGRGGLYSNRPPSSVNRTAAIYKN
ncbi:hypothetical protein T265_10972 [Opisthorchis viverrini]|uniref:Uncharacterized protein n=1 Tax=Opisthorchis viverrini TaxID=6198 RepID=A0A074Z4N4_OPIVI|nr:hypothetical protein T265_10972 [Opisthorchis viverrini]KER20487.1 hypothetical protein T265_10972 [Opisthorchis viverrini]